MKIILCEDVAKVGAQGEVKNVSDGFARNYLLPKSWALPATASNLRKWESEKKVRQVKATQSLEAAKNLAEQLGAIVLEVPAKSGKEGHLFGSVTSAMVSAALLAKNFSVNKKDIVIESPIKTLGEHSVLIRLHREVSVPVKVNIFPEEQAALHKPA